MRFSDFLNVLFRCRRHSSFLHLVESTLQQACLIELMGCTLIVCLLGYFIIMVRKFIYPRVLLRKQKKKISCNNMTFIGMGE